jgi:RNA polymerase sigma-70 factor (ECF subfamily)
MGYAVDHKVQIQSELSLLMPRLASFAAALTGTEPVRQALLKATRNQVLARAAKERGHTPFPIWAFCVMHALWAARMPPQAGEKAAAADPRLFQPRGAGSKLPRFVAQLPAQHRGTLHLVYGEKLSYDEVAEIFNVPVATVMSRLARCHTALIEFEDQGTMPILAAAPATRPEGARSREWAA